MGWSILLVAAFLNAQVQATCGRQLTMRKLVAAVQPTLLSWQGRTTNVAFLYETRLLVEDKARELCARKDGDAR